MGQTYQKKQRCPERDHEAWKIEMGRKAASQILMASQDFS